MSIAISGAISIPPTPSPSSSLIPGGASPSQARATAQPASDTVKLSESQQVHQLFHQGERVSQIAFNLRLTVQAVNGYLGITGKTG